MGGRPTELAAVRRQVGRLLCTFAWEVMVRASFVVVATALNVKVCERYRSEKSELKSVRGPRSPRCCALRRAEQESSGQAARFSIVQHNHLKHLQPAPSLSCLTPLR